jgi:cell division protein FtsL
LVDWLRSWANQHWILEFVFWDFTKMEQQTNTATGKNPLKRLINYQWIAGNIGFFLFLALLAVLYIANGHMADKTIRDANKTAKELKELQYEYKTLKSEVMFRSRETEIIKAAEPLGLKPAAEPPMRIVSESTKKQ